MCICYTCCVWVCVGVWVCGCGCALVLPLETSHAPAHCSIQESTRAREGRIIKKHSSTIFNIKRALDSGRDTSKGDIQHQREMFNIKGRFNTTRERLITSRERTHTSKTICRKPYIATRIRVDMRWLRLVGSLQT